MISEQPIGTAADALTEAEVELVAAASRGERAYLKRETIRAGVLRDLLLETRPGWQVPHAGLWVEDAIIDGCLDLEGCALVKPLNIRHSRLQGGGTRGALLLRDARVKRLGIHASTVEGNIVADRVQIESGLFLGGGLLRGSLYIRGGDVGGALSLEGLAEFGNGKEALKANGMRLQGPLILRRSKVSGEISVLRARMGAIYAEDLQLSHEGVAFNAEGVRVGGDVLLERAQIMGGLRLSNARIDGQIAGAGLAVDGPRDAVLAGGLNVAQGINLSGAKMRGSVWLDGANVGKVFQAEGLEITCGVATALSADVIRIGGDWEMPRAKLTGRLNFPGARIEGQLRLTESTIDGGDVAIRADGSRIRGGCFFSRAVVTGLIRFPASEIGNQFRMRSAALKVEQGPALLASGSIFRRDVELNQGFQTVGAVVLDQVDIGGTCDLRGSRLKSAAVARGGGPAAAGGGQELAIVRSDELALSLIDAKIDRLQMPELAEDRPQGVVELSRAAVGSYEDRAAAWPPAPKMRARSHNGRDIDHLVLDGFVYEHLSNPMGAPDGHRPRREDRVGERRIAWLEGQAAADIREHFKPQAWVQLAARLAAQGYHEDARTIGIARRRCERRSHSATMAARWQSRLLDWLALYGYNPWRTVVWMAVCVLAFTWVWSSAASLCREPGCFDETVFVVSNRDAYTPEKFAAGYPEFHALAYSFDVFVPVVGFGYDTHWRPNMSFAPLLDVHAPAMLSGLVTRPAAAGPAPAPGRPLFTITLGSILYALSIVEALLGLVLTSLAVTGFTGLLRGEE